jgi:DNA-binding transcriptional ArsR family regulator
MGADVVRPGELDMGLLGRLQERSGEPFERGEERGAVLYAGAARLGGGSYVWQVERPVPGLMEIDDELLAKVLSAVASPSRLTLLKALLRGARGTRRLQEALGEVSTGQLYHHLKELQSVGLVVQKGRGTYEVAAQAAIPLLVIVAAVYDLADVGDDSAGG